MFRSKLLASSALALFTGIAAANAQSTGNNSVTLPQVNVTGQASGDAGAPPAKVTISDQVQKYALPNTTASVDKQTIDETVNIVDTEDAAKYLPSIFIRKRNYGDTQPTIETRTWGVNSSARSLVYVDDMPISALIANNNTIGAPRWGLVAPESIEGIDFLYGPFSAQYPGNSMGGVMLITTQMPEKFETTIKQTVAGQDFHVYGTKQQFSTSDTAITVGDKIDRVSWFLSANHEDSFSQPLSIITSSTIPSGTTGATPAVNKTGAVANVVGAGGLLHTLMDTASLKVAVDVNDWLKATYAVSYWSNIGNSSVQTYLSDAGGNPTFGNVSGFGSSRYTIEEEHLMNALTLKSDTKDRWDFEAVVTRYDFLNDIQRTAGGVTATGTGFKTNGTITRLDGTGWDTEDVKGIYRPDGYNGQHEISFGLHRDQFVLNNPTYVSSDWQNSGDTGTGAYSTAGRGTTETDAFWTQEAWKFAPGWRAVLGGRLEQWRTFDGYNFDGTTGTNEPTRTAAGFSPKAAVEWQINPIWAASLSAGQAWRFPTVGELYQTGVSGVNTYVPNASLKPEHVTSYELAVERNVERLRLRASLFWEDTNNAIVQQTTQNVNGGNTSYWQNVAQTRNRGVELVGELRDVLVQGLTLTNSATFVDSRIVSDPGFYDPNFKTATATGKHVPYVPDWRDTVTAAYRPNDQLTLFAAMRYQGTMWSTIDNTDTHHGVMGAFDKFLIADFHADYKINQTITADIGVDNALNAKYFEYHPFPGRTIIGSLKAKF